MTANPKAGLQASLRGYPFGAYRLLRIISLWTKVLETLTHSPFLRIGPDSNVGVVLIDLYASVPTYRHGASTLSARWLNPSNCQAHQTLSKTYWIESPTAAKSSSLLSELWNG
jgi:hypothetical protein